MLAVARANEKRVAEARVATSAAAVRKILDKLSGSARRQRLDRGAIIVAGPQISHSFHLLLVGNLPSHNTDSAPQFMIIDTWYCYFMPKAESDGCNSQARRRVIELHTFSLHGHTESVPMTTCIRQSKTVVIP